MDAVEAALRVARARVAARAPQPVVMPVARDRERRENNANRRLAVDEAAEEEEASAARAARERAVARVAQNLVAAVLDDQGNTNNRRRAGVVPGPNENNDGTNPEANVVNNNHNNDANLVNILLSTSPQLRRFTLTDEELQWARNIKQAFLQEQPEPIKVSDWMVAQIALVSQANIEDAIKRVYGYLGFSEEYDILQECQVNYGVQCVQAFLDAGLEGDFMYLSNSPLESPLFVNDWAQAHELSSQERLKAYFFILQSAQTDLDQIRLGGTFLFDCRGFDWTRNFGYKEYQKGHTEFGYWYPMRIRKTRVFHSPVIVNVMFSMGRKLLRECDRDGLKFGCVSPSGSLRAIYQQPNAQVARHRLLSRVREGLERRKAIEQSFCLPEE